MKIDKAIELAAIGELKVVGESGNQGEAFVIEGDSRTAGWTTISYDSVLSQEVITNEDVALAHLLVHCFNKFPAVLDALRALARDDGGEPCFCGVSIGNPMMLGEHSSACIKARQALKDAEEVEGI